MGAPPGYRPSAWVHLLHQLPRADFQLRPVPSGFAPQEQEYQQVGAGKGVLGPGREARASGSRGRRRLVADPCVLRGWGSGADLGCLREERGAPIPAGSPGTGVR